MPYGLPDGSHTRMKVKKTYRLEQETIEELEKLCSDSGKSATEVIIAVENGLTLKEFFAKMPD